MKNPSRSLKNILYIFGLLILVFSTTKIQATVLYWNNNGTSTPTNGTWDLTTTQWAIDANPTATPIIWDPTAAAGFSVTNSNVGYLGNLTITVNSAVGIAGIFNSGVNGSSPATNLIFNGSGSFLLAADTTNAISVGNASIGGGSGNNNIFYVPITGAGIVDFQAATGSEYLAVSNSYSGGTFISTGNGINFCTNNVFGSGPITVTPTLTQIVLATPNFLPASAGGAAFATNSSIAIPNNVVANVNGAAFKVILVGNASVPITFSGNWDLGTNAQTLDFRNSTFTISGAISGSGPSLTKVGAGGTLVLSGANTYTGKTLINVGAISVSSMNSVTGGNATSSLGHPTTVANGTIALGATTTTGTNIYTGAGETTDRVIDLAGSTGGGTIQNDGTGALIFTSDFTATGAGAKTLTLQGSNSSTNKIVGAIVDNTTANNTSVTKAGTGSWILSGANTFSGKTTISRGSLTVSSLNSVVAGTASSSLGAPTTVANGTIALGASTTSGTLIYVGAGETTDRVINLAGTTGNGTLQNDGTGPLVISSDMTATGAGAKTFTLSGSNTGDNRFNGKIVNSTSATSFTKSGAGTWTLTASNTFTGNLTLNGGRLNLAHPVAGGLGGTNIVGANTSLDNFTGADLILTNALTLSGGSLTYVGTSNNITYTGPVTISGANRTITVSSNTMTLNSGIDDAAGNRSFTKAGAGTLRLLGANTYTGNTTISAGKLVVGASGSFATSNSVTISASGTLDVSAIAAFTVPGTNTFTATGSNTVEGVSAAIIKGGTTVDLGTRPISLTFRPTSFTNDTGHPSLIISQGTLSLGGNAYTVNNASGTALGGGTYQLIQQSSGSITSSGINTVTVTGNGIVPGGTAAIQVSGGDVNLVVTPPSAATIANPTILTNGAVQLNFTGTPGGIYIVEAATNLVPVIIWTPLSTNTADTNGVFSYADTNATNFVERYYRAKNQ